MRYPSGEEARVGYRVRIGTWSLGTVVCSIDLGEYTAEHPREQWGYLGRGVMVLTEKAGLIHYTEPEEDMELISRGGGGGNRE